MKQKYEQPTIEVVKFESTKLLTTSTHEVSVYENIEYPIENAQ